MGPEQKARPHRRYNLLRQEWVLVSPQRTQRPWQRPVRKPVAAGGAAYGPEWEAHAHFYMPLLRSAEPRKFMVGFELLGMPQRDITPVWAAKRIRMASEVRG